MAQHTGTRRFDATSDLSAVISVSVNIDQLQSVLQFLLRENESRKNAVTSLQDHITELQAAAHHPRRGRTSSRHTGPRHSISSPGGGLSMGSQMARSLSPGSAVSEEGDAIPLAPSEQLQIPQDSDEASWDGPEYDALVARISALESRLGEPGTVIQHVHNLTTVENPAASPAGTPGSPDAGPHVHVLQQQLIQLQSAHETALSRIEELESRPVFQETKLQPVKIQIANVQQQITSLKSDTAGLRAAVDALTGITGSEDGDEGVDLDSLSGLRSMVAQHAAALAELKAAAQSGQSDGDAMEVAEAARETAAEALQVAAAARDAAAAAAAGQTRSPRPKSPSSPAATGFAGVDVPDDDSLPKELLEDIARARNVADDALNKARASSSAVRLMEDELDGVRRALTGVVRGLAALSGIETRAVDSMIAREQAAAEPVRKQSVSDLVFSRNEEHARLDVVRAPQSMPMRMLHARPASAPVSTPVSARGGAPRPSSAAPRTPLASARGGPGSRPTSAAGSAVAAVRGQRGAPELDLGGVLLPRLAVVPDHPGEQAGPALGVSEQRAMTVMPHMDALEKLVRDLSGTVAAKANTSDVRAVSAQLAELEDDLRELRMGGGAGGGADGGLNLAAALGGADTDDLWSAMRQVQKQLALLQAAADNYATRDELEALMDDFADAASDGTREDDAMMAGVTRDEFLKLARTVHKLLVTVRTVGVGGGAPRTGDQAALVSKPIVPGYKCLVCDTPLSGLAPQASTARHAAPGPSPQRSINANRFYGARAGSPSGDTQRQAEIQRTMSVGSDEEEYEAARRAPYMSHNPPKQERAAGRSTSPGAGRGGSTLLPNGQVLHPAAQHTEAKEME